MAKEAGSLLCKVLIHLLIKETKHLAKETIVVINNDLLMSTMTTILSYDKMILSFTKAVNKN